MICPHPALVLAETHVQLPMQVVLDAPVAPNRFAEPLRGPQHAEDVVAGPQAPAALSVGALCDRHPPRAQTPPRPVRVHRRRGREDNIETPRGTPPEAA